ncbi:MAG: hypothetical protein V3V62_07360 [bacterium]
MGEKVPCEFSQTSPCEKCQADPSGCAFEVELTPEDAERFLPRDGQKNLIIHKDCPNPPLSSVIVYGPDYYILKMGRVLRKGFNRRLPEY